MTLEVVPGNSPRLKPGAPIPRRLEALLVKYSIENVKNLSHKVGCRTTIETQVINNDGALFAGPMTHPQKLLQGTLLQGKQSPDFLEVLGPPRPRRPRL